MGLGCNNFGRRLDRAGARAVIDAALDAGITHLDTADIYGGDGASERLIGEVLDGRRDRVVLATKFGMRMGGDTGEPRGSRAYLRRAIDGSLHRLRTDRVDLYYYHEPDGVTPLSETLGALAELADEGKIRSFGVSNVEAAQLREAAQPGDDRLAAVQNEYNLLDREAEDEVLPPARELGIGFVPYFPLASGLLTGKFRRGEEPPAGTRMAARPERLTDATFDRIEALAAFAAARGRTLLELAIAGLACQPGVASVIAGAMTPEQVRSNAAAAEWVLSADDLAALAEVR
ncbi:MAG TPA: aldo/keto reductase [Solirubrobacteraceae bacterium]|nr:aldo/keto reductase [Solirubrobacteraceae bacterium]